MSGREAVLPVSCSPGHRRFLDTGKTTEMERLTIYVDPGPVASGAISVDA